LKMMVKIRRVTPEDLKQIAEIMRIDISVRTSILADLLNI